MDHSSLADAQKQQHQSDQQQAYDPAQAQAYAAYYAACNQYYAASAYYNQPYYPHAYSSSSTAATAATAGAYYAETQPDSSALQADASQIHHPGSHLTPYAPATEAPGGLNSAAVAALSQLSQLTGSIDAAERMMATGMHNRPQYPHPVTMQHRASSIRPGVGTHRSGGRKGGGPIRGRGGNRGRIGQRSSGRDGGGPPPLRGRWHGRMSRGRGRRLQHFTPDSQERQTAIENTIETSTCAQERPLFAPKAPQKSLIPVAWCDICRVDCNSPEILEQHKNGKRHKRTVRRIQEIQTQQNVISAGLQFNYAAKPDLFLHGVDGHELTNDGQASTSATNRAIPSSASGAEAVKSLAGSRVGEFKNEDTSSAQEPPALEESIEGIVAFGNIQPNVEIGSQCKKPEEQAEPVSGIADSGGLLTDASQDGTLPIDGLSKKRRSGYDRNDRWRGSRQKMMRIGRGGNHFKSFERTHGRPFERPKERPRDRPRVCTVCNIMCDTMAVFECHLSGKKHVSRIKRFEGYGSVYGPINVYIPPNQPTTYPNKGPEPLFYGLQSLENLQHDNQKMEILAGEQCHQVESFEETEGASPESEFKQSIGQPEEESPVTDANVDLQVVVIPDLNGENSLNEPDEVETNNNSASDDGDLMECNVLPIVADSITLPEHGTSNEAEIVVPGLDASSEEPLADNE